MRVWVALLALLLLGGCSSPSTTGEGDVPVSGADTDATARQDIQPADTQVDVDVQLDQTETVDPCAPPASSLCPCEDGKDCLSGFCELHLGEKVCTRTCVEDCPEGWECVDYSAGGPDRILLCVSLHPSLCVPCVTKGDCHGVDDCFAHGPKAGAFCSPWCGVDLACPSGFTCSAIGTITGVPGFACLPDDGECSCSAYSTKKHKSTVCEITNEWGTCGGARICDVDGLSPCNAPTPAEEVCDDGEDNDCDGFTDPVMLCPVCLCGDGVCQAECGEDIEGADFCPADCCLCGDGACEPDPCGEGWEPGFKTCALDCAVCGDEVCDPGEGPQICPEDCCGTCGDGKCKCAETPILCPEDCGQWACGDGTCNPGENPIECSVDCESYACGNGTCDPGEGPDICSADCATACGDCACEGGESYDTCPVDCGFCGDGYCIATCDYVKETSVVCPADCGEDCGVVCQGYECGLWGFGDQCDCGTCVPPLSCVFGACVGCGDEVCGVGEHVCNCPEDCSAGCPGCCSGATCQAGDDEDFCGVGGVTCKPCGAGEVCDTGLCVCLPHHYQGCFNGDVFWFNSCDLPEDVVQDCGEHYTCEDGACLYVPWCGDGNCDANESCNTCNADCGACCGNGVCEGAFGESCPTCPEDCEVCWQDMHSFESSLAQDGWSLIAEQVNDSGVVSMNLATIATTSLTTSAHFHGSQALHVLVKKYSNDPDQMATASWEWRSKTLFLSRPLASDTCSAVLRFLPSAEWSGSSHQWTAGWIEVYLSDGVLEEMSHVLISDEGQPQPEMTTIVPDTTAVGNDGATWVVVEIEVPAEFNKAALTLTVEIGAAEWYSISSPEIVGTQVETFVDAVEVHRCLCGTCS